MIDADYAQGQITGTRWQMDWYRGSIEGCVDVVDRDWVVRVRGIAGNVAHHAKLATRGR